MLAEHLLYDPNRSLAHATHLVANAISTCNPSLNDNGEGSKYLNDNGERFVIWDWRKLEYTKWTRPPFTLSNLNFQNVRLLPEIITHVSLYTVPSIGLLTLTKKHVTCNLCDLRIHGTTWKKKWIVSLQSLKTKSFNKFNYCGAT